MPIEIKPVSGSWYGDPRTGRPTPPKRQRAEFLPSSYKWLADQQFDFDRYQVGVSPFRAGTVGGGLSDSQSQLLAHWQQNATVPDPPALTASILHGKQVNPRIGNLTLNMIDPLATLTELTGSYLGRKDPIVGYGGTAMDPMAFLQSKGIDPAGLGSTGAPVRLLDYAAAPIDALADMLSGRAMPDRQLEGKMAYKFQEDGTYWGLIANANDDQLRQAAVNLVSRTADPATNQYLVDQLFATFQADRDQAAGLTSGNGGVDYRVIKSAGMGARADVREAQGQWFDPGDQAQMALTDLLKYIPFGAGTEITKALYPVTEQDKAAWAAEDPNSRKIRMQMEGSAQMAYDIVGSLPVFAVGGEAAMLAKGAGGMASKAYTVYDGLLKASKASMALGVTAAATNWALEAYWPEDFNMGPITGQGVKEYTTRVDLSRPFSESDFAGVINALGFMSSGSFGSVTAAKAGSRALMGGANRIAGVFGKTVGRGMEDLRLYIYGLGGTPVTKKLAALGLDETGLRVSAARLYMSETLNQIRRERFAMWSAAISGNPVGNFLDHEPLEVKIALASADMSRPLAETMAEAETKVRSQVLAREDDPLLSYDAITEKAIVKRNARAHDDGLARQFVSQYGAGFMHRLAGADTPEAIRNWLTGAVERLGGKADALPSTRSQTLEQWHQMARAVYHYGFDRWAGLVHAASDGAEEAGRISIMSRRHLFRDEVDTALKVLRGGDEEAAASLLADLSSKIEVEDWILAETEKAARTTGSMRREAWTPSAKGLADHIEDIRQVLGTRRRLPDAESTTAGEPLNVVHRQMEEEGVWTIGFKPVDEAGDFTAAVETRTGQHVQTRWLDYPLSNIDNIEVGNRGMMASRMDAVTRGFRSWRLAEYQRGSLFRSLSDKLPDATTAQIDAFHNGILRLSREHGVSPQAVGRIGGAGTHQLPIFRGLADDVDQLAKRVFGPGPHLDAAGKRIDWYKEIGSAYRQSYRLNLTAGLTSHLKASFGPIGEAITVGSDFAYVLWRFGMSPLFKGGELWESAQFNLMRHVNPNADPFTQSLYIKAGIGGDPAALAAETGADQLAAGLQMSPFADTVGMDPARRTAMTADARNAYSLSMYARNMAEDHTALMARLAKKKAAEEFRAAALGGEAFRVSRRDSIMSQIADMTDEAGNLHPDASPDVLKGLLRDLDYEELPDNVKAALDAWPEGAPTADQLETARNLSNEAATLRNIPITMPGDYPSMLEAKYKDLIKRGIMEADPQVALRDRYVELIDNLARERINARLWHQGAPGASGVKDFDLTDPITGLPTMRDPVWASDREFDTALRSLRGRLSKIHVTTPTAEEMALHIDAAAEAAAAPRPILRSDRVGPEEMIPEGYVTDPADVYVMGSSNMDFAKFADPYGEGVISWLDPERPAEARGLWHATTAMDGVLDTGLFSRHELIQQNAERYADAFHSLVDAYQGGLSPSDLRVTLRNGITIHLGHLKLAELAQGGERTLIDEYSGVVHGFNEVASIEDTLNGKELYRATGPEVRTPEGLSARTPDRLVSTTTEYDHAATGVARMKVASMAARGEIGGAEIVAHFDRYYEDLLGAEDGLREMARRVGVTVPDAATEEQIYDAVVRGIDQDAGGNGDLLFRWVQDLDHGLKNAAEKVGWDGFNGSVILAADSDVYARIRPEQVGMVQVAVKHHQIAPIDPVEGFDVAQRLHAEGKAVRVEFTDTGGTTIYATTPDQLANSFSEAVGEKAAAGEKLTAVGWLDDTGDFIPELGNARSWQREPRVGKDPFEVQFHSSDLYVIDPRTEAEPLADNETDLLRQFRQTIDDQGQTLPGMDKRHDEIAHELDRYRQQALNPDPVTSIDEIPETAEGISANLDDLVAEKIERTDPGLAAKIRSGGRTFWDPVPTKLRRQQALEIQHQREEFPRAIAGTPVYDVFAGLHIPEQQWADWFLHDRALLNKWNEAMVHGTPDEAIAAMDDLVGHAGTDAQRKSMDEFYGSEEYAVLSSLWALNLKGVSEDAFSTHFFDQYRSPLLRSINHPVLGVYPAAWAVKTAREWGKFLFDNRMFGVDLRLGMTPAVALNNIVRAQSVAFAQAHPGGDGTLDDYMRNGPLGSSIFVFNLLMPGDWSAIPFPMSRTIREVLRGNVQPGDILGSNLDYMGLSRDWRLGAEMLGEWTDVATKASGIAPEKPQPGWLQPTVSVGGTPVRPHHPPKWVDQATR